MSNAETDTRANRRDRYHKVLRIVEYHTRPESPLISKTSVKQVASQAGVPKQKLDAVIQAAIDNEDLMDYHGKLALVEKQKLRDVLTDEVDADITRKPLVKRCNAHLKRIRDREGESQ